MGSDHIRWTDDMDAMLGTEHDVEVAAVLGISRDSVQARRKALGVPQYSGNRRKARTCANCGGKTSPRSPSALGPVYCSDACSRAGRKGRQTKPRQPCKVSGCGDERIHAKGMCQKHYLRAKNGQPLDAPSLTANAGRECKIDGCSYAAYCKALCTLHYGRLRNYGDPLREPPTFEERFWAKVDKTGGPDACWLWTGTLSVGYGNMAAEPGHPQERAHVVSWRLTGRPVVTGQHLDHTCHTKDPDCPGGLECLHRRCCNPNHLEPVTLAENNRRSWQRRLDGATCSKGHKSQRDNRGRCRQCRRERGEIPKAVKAAVTERCQGLCEGCGEPLNDGRLTHFHHRLARSQGGENSVGNIVALHSTCHVLASEAVHQRPAWAKDRGLIVPRGSDPGAWPLVLPSGRRVLLDPNLPWYQPVTDGLPYAV